MTTDRDFFAEGADAAIAGNSDIPPQEVSDLGVDAEGSWIDGYNSIVDLEES